ncbi:MAG: hypothetical protein UHX00_05610 [Caryophanon sp.]|nr:hypothetical protein [Caryophanon sp.]
MVRNSTLFCFIVFLAFGVAAYMTFNVLFFTLAMLAIGIMTAIFAVDALMGSRIWEGLIHTGLTALFLGYGFFGEYLLQLL